MNKKNKEINDLKEKIENINNKNYNLKLTIIRINNKNDDLILTINDKINTIEKLN